MYDYFFIADDDQLEGAEGGDTKTTRYTFTVKFLNFGTQKNFAVIIVKLEKSGVMHPKDADSIANSEDPDQRGAV